MQKTSNLLDIGPRPQPAYWISKDVKKRLQNGWNYFGMDIGIEDLERAANENPGYALQGNLIKLPIKNNCVDEIWLMNVFGGFVNPPKKRNGSTTYTIGFNFGEILKDLGKILKTGGKILMGEYYRGPDLSKYDFSDTGFEAEIFNNGDAEKFLERYRFSMAHSETIKKWSENPVFVELRKKDN
ncbi:hypothetical protein GOV13_00640 [Candidatus Pacearchaeota archaeon]|nr:hypothetical protein [Candidatus Pacearchaeota archaeon]